MKRPSLVGIVNVTPDSFSGDGRMGEAVLPHALSLLEDGADMLDIGAESTRPGAAAITAEEEWARLEPLLKALKGKRLSVDSYHAETAAKALALGVSTINDVNGLRDAEMCRALVDSTCDVIVMHSLTVPVDPSVNWSLEVQPVQEILRWKAEVTARAESFGIAASRLIFDPGIGFGKSAEQSLALMTGASELKISGGRWLYGHSRKSFMKLLSDAEATDRDALTLAFSVKLASVGIDYLRVHNVRAHAALFGQICT